MEAQRRGGTPKRARKEEEKPKVVITQRSKSTKYIPHEIVHDILLRVPAKSLVRFKDVCQSWRALISDPGFIKLHLNYLANKDDVVSYCQISSVDKNPQPSLTFIHRDAAASEIETVKLLQSPFNYQAQSVELLGSCNGLLLIGISSITLLWNPTTRESHTLARNCRKTGRDEVCISGLGYDSSLDKYTAVISFVEYEECDLINVVQSDIFVCSSSRGGNWSWKKIDGVNDFPYLIFHPHALGITVNGAPHWAGNDMEGYCSSSNKIIIYFDMVDEKFKRLPTPSVSWKQLYGVTLAVLEGCLICTNHCLGVPDYYVWAMKEYGVVESWTKLFVIRMPSMLSSLVPLGFTKKGNEVVLSINGNKLVAYNLITEEATLKCSTTSNCSGAVYVESLVSPRCS